MAVGKSSIMRAASAGSKVKQSVLTPDQEVMKQVQFMAEPEKGVDDKMEKEIKVEAAEVVTEGETAVEKKEAAPAEPKPKTARTRKPKAASAKPAAKSAGKKTTAPKASTAKKSADKDEKEEKAQNAKRNIAVKDELPIYLL